jgi:hypothetical protein
MIEHAPDIGLEFLRLYLTLAFMAIGAGLMVGGPRWAGKAGRLFFVRPVVAIAAGVRLLVTTLLSGTWTLLARLLLMSWAVLLRFILWPVIDELRFWLRWLGGRSRR